MSASLPERGVPVAQLLDLGWAGPRPAAASPPIVIALVNSMPGEARRHTEQQFRGILAAAAPDVAVDLRFYSLGAGTTEGAERGPALPRYGDTATLPSSIPDGMIVTGMPPRAPALPDEPYWHAFTELVDFATAHAVPTVWSCLAAHAAVLHLDGIERRRLPEKLSGLVECARTEDAHPAMAGLPARWLVPHSRYNEVPEAALLARGYRILVRSDAAGADIFVDDTRAPFLFCQGHPEYDAHALLREYRRDVRQFLAFERDRYPAMPDRYFGAGVAALLDAFRVRAERARGIDMFAEFPLAACAADLRHSWHDLSVSLYTNWLAQVAGHKARRAGLAANDWPAPLRRSARV
jgi:homoserine O-succinyltransferase